MKKILFGLLILASVVLAQGGSPALQAGLNQLQSQAQTLALYSMIFSGIIAIVFLGIAIFIYLKKIKGMPKPDLLWIVIALISGLIGVLSLISAVLGLITVVSAPYMIKSLTTG